MTVFNKVAFLIVIIFLSNNMFAQHQGEKFAKDFIKAVVSKDIDEFVKLKPGPDLWRKILEKETKGMTDEEINQKANKNEKFIQDYKNFLYSAKAEKIDLVKLNYKKSKVEKIWDDEKMPFGITIKYDYEGKEGEFSLSVFKFDGNYYLYEILVSYDVFGKLK